MKETLLDIMEQNGIEYEDDKLISKLDSIQYISAMVAIEEEFEIEIPEQYLVQNVFENLDHLSSIISEIKGQM